MQDPAIIILVCTPLPWPHDEIPFVRKLFRTTAMLKEVCEKDSTLQYVRATQDMSTLQGVNRALITNEGMTLAGKHQIAQSLLGKINCGRL